ncbi:hypothetical protein CHU92_12370 [Flavobacterium cyanobacteriorum]|uniref:Uncharacterized protein n=1 Tax=Flavobacterium cyanobacteriorum TaxID=2022802 RepID=A0A255YZW8_9FLAO|nr:tetratricopeptide repeat protein [Flavobacterium cyanobacteriorum]OYQ33950.1 hypothetical protein CHU92_12370 [Flavobacterium cyanobacteriorum]
MYLAEFGFIYLDRTSGFTFSYEGKFHIKEGKERVLVSSGLSGTTKYRLDRNTIRLQIMPESIRKILKLPVEPDWLHVYRKGEEELEALIRRGFHYNHVGGSELAIPILLKAYAKDPHAETLEFELSYAYNATEQYDKAVEVLNKAIKHDPKNFWFLRELGYAYLHLDKIDEAEKTYKKGIAMTDNTMQQAEMAFNTAGMYYRLKNRKKFDEWLAVARKYAEKDSPYYKPLEDMEANFGKN